MSSQTVDSDVVLVKVVGEPGKERRALVAKFGRIGFIEANIGVRPLLILPARPTRLLAFVNNGGPGPITISDDSSVTAVTGYRLADTDPPQELRGQGPVYGIIDSGADTAIYTIDQFFIPYTEYERTVEKKKR